MRFGKNYRKIINKRTILSGVKMRERIVKEYDIEDYMAVKNGLSRRELCTILIHIKHHYLPDYHFSGTEEDYENYRLRMAMCKAINYISGRNTVVFPDE